MKCMSHYADHQHQPSLVEYAAIAQQQVAPFFQGLKNRFGRLFGVLFVVMCSLCIAGVILLCVPCSVSGIISMHGGV